MLSERWQLCIIYVGLFIIVWPNGRPNYAMSVEGLSTCIIKYYLQNNALLSAGLLRWSIFCCPKAWATESMCTAEHFVLRSNTDKPSDGCPWPLKLKSLSSPTTRSTNQVGLVCVMLIYTIFSQKFPLYLMDNNWGHKPQRNAFLLIKVPPDPNPQRPVDSDRRQVEFPRSW